MASGISQEIGSVERSVREAKHRAGSPEAAKCWTRALAAASLVAGAILLARGKRRPGLASAATAMMIVLLEHPQEVSAVWNGIPAFLRTSKRLIDRVEGIVEDLSLQAEKVRGFLENAERQQESSF